MLDNTAPFLWMTNDGEVKAVVTVVNASDDATMHSMDIDILILF